MARGEWVDEAPYEVVKDISSLEQNVPATARQAAAEVDSTSKYQPNHA